MTGDAAEAASRPRRRRRAWRWALVLLIILALATPTIIATSNRYGWVGPIRLTDVKELGSFEFDARHDGDDAIPADRRALDGRKVILVGEMYAPDAATGQVSQFQIIMPGAPARRSEPPRVQERVFATVSAAKTVPNMSGRSVEVHGTLHVKAERIDGEVISLFEIDVDHVDPVTHAAAFGGNDPTSAIICTAIAAPFVAGIAWALWLAARRDRPPTGWWPGYCARCGYDLRGSAARCPECGTPFAPRDPP